MRILIRTDASIQIGSGHVMRCLTLADALRKRGAETWFACRKQEGHLGNEIERRGHGLIWLTASGSPDSDLSHSAWLGVGQIADAEETARSISHQNPDWLIVDHYALDHRWETWVKPSVGDILVIDDLADRKHVCSVLLDQNLYDDADARYAELVSPEAQLLLGPPYALLRPEFTLAREQLRTRNGGVKRILVFFGGADPGNATGKALAALSASEFASIFVDVVVGASNPHRDSLAKACQARPNTVCCIQVDNMAELMSLADLAIGAGGTTTWERCCLGLPSLVICVADNQSELIENLDRIGAIQWLGRSTEVTSTSIANSVEALAKNPGSLRTMSEAATVLVDGHGTERVANVIAALAKPVDLPNGSEDDTGRVVLRRAKDDDLDLYFDWANETETRRNSYGITEISMEMHVSWFQARLSDPECCLYILESDGVPAGQIRFQFREGAAEIAFSVALPMRGRGLATRLLKAGLLRLRKDRPGRYTIRGLVKKGNSASTRAFLKAGFSPAQETVYQGVESLLFIQEAGGSP